MSVNKASTEAASIEYGEDVLPIPANQRYAGGITMFWLWAGGNILLTTFLLGGYYATALGAVGMIVVTIAGSTIGNLFPSLSGLRSARYGVDEYVGMRSTYGTFGAYIGILLLVLINFGWVGILGSVAGESGKASLAELHSHWRTWYTVFGLGFGLVVPVILLYISPKTIFTLVKGAVPLLIIFAVVLLVKQFTSYGWHDINSAAPDHSVSWQYAIEANIAYAVSWFAYMGAWNRFAKSENGAFWGAWIGLALIAFLFAIVGGIATLTTGSSDPSVWATKSGLGVPALAIIIFSTIINNAMLLYCSAMGLRTAFPKLNYHFLVVAVALPSIVFVYVGSLQDNFNNILTGVGALIAPYWGVALGDYFLVRRQRIDLAGLYRADGGPYWFKGGFNLVALGVWLLGVALWIFLGGWNSALTWLHIDAGEPFFNVVTATAPVIIVTAVVYWAAMRLMSSEPEAGAEPAPAATLGGEAAAPSGLSEV
ncbi:MAG TPA: cytosine permease [Solirubrobacterales bacterium]|nr:cytosine permease [Solirubrobacterales bacterium]